MSTKRTGKRTPIRSSARAPIPTRLFERRLSPNQYALMRAVASGEAKHGMRTLEAINYTTLTPLIDPDRRAYLTLDARNNLVFTEAGLEAYRTYQDLTMPQRKAPGAITEFVTTMFHLANGNGKGKR